MDLCVDYDNVALRASTFPSATPAGGVKAGKYTKDKVADSLPSCLATCCARTDSCDVVFFHDDTCFLIQCNSTAPELCEPESRDEEKFRFTYMIRVRDTEPPQTGEEIR